MPDSMRLEELHPLQLTGARLISDALEFRYQLEGRGPGEPGRITSARLIGPGMDVPLAAELPGVLRGPLPEVAGRFTIQVDQAEGCAEGAPSLPWRVDVRLAPGLLEDYRSAEPLDARVDLPGGAYIRVRRMLRRRNWVVLFWEGYLPGGNLPAVGRISGELAAGQEKLAPGSYPYALGGEPQRLRPSPPGLPASAMAVRVQARAYYGCSENLPLAWRIHHGRLVIPETWRLEVELPSGRPAALAPDLAAEAGGMRLRLEELWLARSQTTLRFSGMESGLDLFDELYLEDDEGNVYHPKSSSRQNAHTEYRFDPVSPAATRLRVVGRGVSISFHGAVEVPLVSGGQEHAPSVFSFDSPTGFAAEPGAAVSDEPSPADHPEEPQVETPSDLPLLQEWLASKAQPALRIRLKPTHIKDLSPVESHLHGPPFWPNGEPWPVCGHCDRPLTFVGQVRLDGEGAPRVGSGKLLTFHYCLHCLPWGPDDASAYRLRLHSDTDAASLTPVAPPPVEDADHFYWAPVPCRIVLAPTVSVPDWEDAPPEVTRLRLGEEPWDTYRTACEAIVPSEDLSADMDSRLGGYPNWIQSSDWPSCPECGEEMRLIWQLDSEPAAGIMWGDTGRVYIFACPRPCSENALALVMQCC